MSIRSGRAELLYSIHYVWNSNQSDDFGLKDLCSIFVLMALQRTVMALHSTHPRMLIVEAV